MAKHNWVGAEAEQRVCEYLDNSGYKVIDQNWKTKFCEIDLIATKDNCVFFVEVKYRATDEQGGGFDVINKQKLHKMQLGAQTWVSKNNWENEYTLSVASVSGDDYKIDFIDDIYN